MLTWISRILIFVFIFNTISPELLWAQQNTRPDDLSADISRSLTLAVREQVHEIDSSCFLGVMPEELEKCYTTQKQKLMELYNSINAIEDMAGFSMLATVVEQLHSLRAAYRKRLNELAAAADFSNPRFKPMEPVADALYVAPRPDMALREEQLKGRTFLDELAANKYDLNDLIEKIDPIEEQFSPLISAYSAEVILNTLNQSLSGLKSGQIDPMAFALTLPRIQVRALYRLNRFESPEGDEDKAIDTQLNSSKPWFPEDSIMFRGTLRILLYQIHRLYQEMGLEDPMTVKWEESVSAIPFIRPTQETYQKAKNRLEEMHTMTPNTNNIELGTVFPSLLQLDYDSFCQFYQRPLAQGETIPTGWEVVQEVSGTRTISKDESIFREFMKKFIDEFKEFHKKAKPGKSAYAFLNLQTQYVVRYALLAGFPLEILTMVAVLEGDEAPENEKDIVDFKLKFGSILETLFGTITETAKIYPIDNATVGLLQLELVNLAGPQNATATRALALSAAGLLHVSQKWNAMENPYNNEWLNEQQRVYASVNNNLAFNDDYRQKLAAYAVDLYAPMQYRVRPFVSSPNRSQETYGLDADQMLAFSDQLTNAIDNLCPLQEPNTVWTNEHGYIADTEHLVTITDLNRGQFTGQLPNGELSSGTIPVFMFDSNNNVFDVYLLNALNQRQRRLEEAKVYVKLLFEAALWAFGGEIIMFGIRALQMTHGAVVMVPKAFQAAKAANKGEKLAEFGKTVQQGWRYGSTNFRATHVGATFTTTRTEEVVRHTAESGEHIVNGQKAARTTLEGVGATEKIQAPVTRYGSGYYNPTAMDITGAEYAGKGWLGRTWNGFWHGTPEIERVTVFQNGQEFTLNANRLGELGVNTRRLSTSDKIAIWREIEGMEGFSLNPYNYTHPNWLHPFDFGRWFGGRKGGFGGFSRPGTTSSNAMSEQRAAEILGLEGDITEASLKKAYRNLALKWAPDRWMATGTEAEIAFASNKMAEINAAYEMLSKGGASGLRMSATVGMPEGFDMPLQLTRNATSPSARQVLWNNALHRGWNTFTDAATWFGQSYWANLKFFTLWHLWDKAIYPAQWAMMDHTITTQTQEAMDKYGNSFKPDPSDPAPNPYAAEGRVDVVSDVNNSASQRTAYQGALISTPILGTMILFGKDFTKGQTQTQLRTLSKRIDYTRALNKRSQAQNQALFDSNVKMHLGALARQRQSYQQRMAKDKEHLFTQECKAILLEIDKAEATLNQLANSEDKLADKFTQFVTWAELPDLHKAENAYWLKIIDTTITQMEENMLLVGDGLSNEQRYQIHQLLAQAKQKRAAKDIDGALQVIENINKTWTEEKAATAALTLEQERALAQDDALAMLALYEETYSSVIGLTPKEQRQLTKQIKALTKQARKEILNVSKQKDLTLSELQIQYTDIYNNLWLQIETVLSAYAKDKPSSKVTTKGITEIDEDNELGIQ
ncbi:DnaJ domain-containing protein [Candidatus Avelusimicrobium luingense]|uniref:DnaJ domain-containing protein n=1 Tax=Candidatus Avelusimicrobium luingense TaxID=3416211 RepID=UPI003D0E607B